MLLLHLLYLLIFSSIFCHGEICDEDNCQLPSCQCPMNDGNPTPYEDTDVPQFILLTFIGNLNKNTLEPIQKILNLTHRNPNKCPISSTFFIHHAHTEYCLVQRLFDNQNEIGITASNNKCPLTNCYNENDWNRWTNNEWKQEIKQQRINIVENAQIHQSHIKGFRAPHLQIDENQHFEYLKQFNFHYDSSMLFKSSNLIWPFTHNYPFDQTDCINCNGWNKPFEALWQFPLHEWTYPNANVSCRTLSDSSCLPANKPHSLDLYYNFLMHNFERHTSLSIGYRSPFIIELDLSWLSQDKNQSLQALIRFIKYILNNPNYNYVYFISIEKALEYLKYPRSLDEIKDFWAFKCNDKYYEYTTDCSIIELNENEQNDISITEKLKSNNKTNTTDSKDIDRQAEKLFLNGIALHALWITILLIFCVVFYDKYFTK